MKKFLVAICLIVSLGVVGSWAWSYQRQYNANVRFPSGSQIMLTTGGGRIAVEWGHSDSPPPPRIEFKHFTAPAATGLGVNSFWTWLGFYRFIDSRTALIVVPHWLFVVMPTAVLAVMPIARAMRRRRRRQLGLCPRCGYDLRGVTGRCPECGEPAPAARPPTGPPA
jgi:hypothetical protein